MNPALEMSSAVASTGKVRLQKPISVKSQSLKKTEVNFSLIVLVQHGSARALLITITQNRVDGDSILKPASTLARVGKGVWEWHPGSSGFCFIVCWQSKLHGPV